MIFTGSYEHNVDTKGRLAIPAELRAQIQRAVGSVEKEPIILNIVPSEGALCVYTEKQFEKRAQELEESDMDPELLLMYEEMFYSSSRTVKIDAQGRINLPQDLAKEVDLGQEVVILGVKDHLKIRSRKSWQAQKAELLKAHPGLLANPRSMLRKNSQ